jgi:CheY-like chemotaxis protein
LLAFARAQQLEIKSIDLRGFLDEMTTLLRPSLRSDIELVIESSANLRNIDADAGALELAILNLAFNARDSMKDGGTLKLSAANITLDGQPVGLTGEHVALKVSDTGEGMTRETMERIFEPFFTTKSYGEGTGLGLSQVFGFLRQIGGAVTVESELGKGALFTLYFPVTGSTETRTTEGAGREGNLARGQVLIVEDDLLVAELAAGLMAELGFDSTVVHSSKDALDHLAKSDRPTFVFSDVVMPGGISGIELARKVRTRFPELPILLTTGYSEHAAGNHGFPVLQKPYEMETLVRALRELLPKEELRT